MADVHTPQQWRFNMQQVRSTDTKPEMLVRRFLHARGYRYRLHDKKLPCKPVSESAPPNQPTEL